MKVYIYYACLYTDLKTLLTGCLLSPCAARPPIIMSKSPEYLLLASCCALGLALYRTRPGGGW